MPEKVVTTDQAAPAGGPYSQAVAGGDYVCLAAAVRRRTTLPANLRGFDVEADVILYTGA